MNLKRIGGCLAINILLAVQDVGWAQGEPAFDVVSVRENRSADPSTPSVFGTALTHPPGRFVLQNWSVRALIAYAHDLPSSNSREVFTLRGGRDDVLERRFDITATLPSGVRAVPVYEERAMLRTLLADRFGLRVHAERQRARVFALRRQGELGQGLRPLEMDCATWRAKRLSQPVDGDGNLICVTRTFVPPGAGFQIRDHGDVARLVWWVQQFVERPVVDETGLSGSFAFDITFALSFVPSTGIPSHPSIFTAVREQLGLKLEPTEAEVDVVVIDAVSLPEPN